MEHKVDYKKISLEDNLSGVMELMYLFPEKYSEEYVKKEIIDHKGPYGIWVAEDEKGRTAGFSLWHHVDEREACFWLTGVKHGYRGLGVGKKLLDLAISDVIESRYRELSLVTFESCKGMIKLCKQRKFRELKRNICDWNVKDDIRIEYVLEFHPLARRE